MIDKWRNRSSQNLWNGSGSTFKRGDAIEVFWALDPARYRAKVILICITDQEQFDKLIYDDGQEEEKDLQKESWRFVKRGLNQPKLIRLIEKIVSNCSKS